MRIDLAPEADGAVPLEITLAGPGSVVVLVEEGYVIELTAPITVNAGAPERHSLDVLRDERGRATGAIGPHRAGVSRVGVG